MNYKTAAGWQTLWEALCGQPAGFLYPQESPQYQQWLKTNAAAASQFHHQQYPRHLDRLSRAQELEEQGHFWVGNRVVVIDAPRWKNLWCLI